MLHLLRLKYQHPRIFKRFLKRYLDMSDPDECVKLFTSCFPLYDGGRFQ